MHGLRSAVLAGEKGAPAAQLSTEEECRRKGARDPSRPASERERARDERRVAAQRRDKRHREVVERATIVLGRKRSLVRVVNISDSGLTIETPLVPPVGQAILVELPAGPVEAVVRWVRRGRIGLDVGQGGTGIAPRPA
jgi:hypothetical protein